MHLYFARSRQSKNKQTKNKEKIHGKRYNTIPVATYIMAVGMTRQKKTELFQWLGIYIQKNATFLFSI